MTRLAIVHDWLDRAMGGAERVTLEIARMFPDAPLYTLLYDERRDHGGLDPGRVRTSRLQRLPEALRRRPRHLLPLIPGAVEAWDFSGFDIVISSSSAFVKNIVTPATTIHVCYCHSPMRFAWDYWPRYLDELGGGRLRRAAISTLVSRMRRWDLSGVAGVDAFVANSATTRARIRSYYGVDSCVVHPPVDVSDMAPAARRGDDYVTLSTLTEYKRIDLAVQAFTDSGRSLLVIGDGPDRQRLEAMAGSSVRFAGHVSDVERIRLLARARGLVFPNEEDFGIAAIEALASGAPVIGYARGGLTETIDHGRTGILFEHQTATALNDAVDAAEATLWDVDALAGAAAEYRPARFRSGLSEAVEVAVKSHGDRCVTDETDAATRILGVRVDPLTVGQAVARIVARAADRHAPPAYVVKPYVEFFRHHSDDVTDVLNSAWLSLADGVALQWAAAYQAGPPSARRLASTLAAIVARPESITAVLPERAAGATFTWRLLEAARDARLTVFLVGSPKRQSITATASHLSRAIPGLSIVGTAPGRGDQLLPERLTETVKRSGADLVLVGLGFPRQELLMAELCRSLDHGVLVGEGGTFDYREFGGTIARAPAAVRRSGLEWLWRLGREPARLRRQLAIPRFIGRVHRQAVGRHRRPAG